MAEAQKIVELPKETTEVAAPVETTAAPVEETKPAEETAAPVEAATATEEVKPAEAAEEAKAEEKEEVKPIEEGYLGHKAQGLSFPKNLIASKEFFFFGTDSFEPKSLSAYQRSEKSAEVAQSNIAWASETGKGLLFVGDKKAPSSIINLADAKEPEVDGANKFTLASKGNKHTFKATNTAERDNWVSQLKLKIAEAKELAPTVAESETYKATLESFKPAKKEEKPAAAAAEKGSKAEETPATADEAPKEDTVAAPVADDATKEEAKAEEPKRRSASRKRASFFGFGAKKDAAPKSPKAEESKKLEEPTAVEPLAAEAAAPETEAPKTEEAATDAPAAADEKPSEEVKTPPTSKRNSFFGGVFGKKERKTADVKPEAAKPADASEDTATKEEDKVADAPVIPPVEASTPLAVEVNNPGTVPVETVEATPATAAEEPKKDVKEKRKSSLPFAFGKRDKSPTPASDGESPKAQKSNPFSKFRATIKGKAPKTEEKTEETAKEETAVDSKAEETPAPVAETSTDAAPVTATQEATEPENKPENVSTTTPAVTAAA